LNVPVVRIPRPASICAAIVVLILAIPALPVHGQSPDPATLDQISSKRYIVIDDQTGEIYAQKEAEVRSGIASVTKIFTAIVALERAPLDMEITANESDLFDSTSTSMAGFAAGTTYTVRDLLYGMILESGNDAAHTLARGIGAQPGDTDEDSVNRFVGWMNEKVAELGLKDTHFVNPHGLSDPDHYSTPRDIATFMMYAVQNADFMAIISARTYTTTTGDTQTSVNRGPEFIPDYVGGKTGYDDATGYCLVEVGERDDAQLVSVTIDGVAPDIWYQDHAILQEYGFLARAERIASGQPVGDVLAYAGQPGSEPAQADVQVEQQTPPASDTFAGVDTGPRPVLVTGTPVPVTAANDDGDSPFDNWLIGMVIAAIVAGSLWMHTGMKLRFVVRRPVPEPDIEIDT
jgi:D-alanyl-D-alanine carboxypeptidase (penicillin-binding protein 5/6)